MKELISIHIGQAGSQIGNSCWEYFTQQHGISSQGKLITETSENQVNQTFFYETQSSKYVPRSIFVDLQPSVIDEIRSGPYRELFNSRYLISGKEDAANNFCRGHFTIGKEYIEQTYDMIRKLTQNCSNFGGFMIYNSICGGTGSGFGSLLEQRLSVDYRKKQRIGFKLLPSAYQNSVVEPYNSVLTTHSMMEHEDVTIIFNNDALNDISCSKLGVQSPNYANTNRLIAKVASEMTLPMRFGGTQSTDLGEVSTNLIPYPRIHFVVPSYSPFIEKDSYTRKITQNDLTSEVFQASNQMMKCNPLYGKYMASSLFYSGQVHPKNIIESCQNIRNNRTVNFVDWCPTGFKVSINQRSPQKVNQEVLKNSSKSCLMLSNTSSIHQTMSDMEWKYDIMYAKRGYVHWYVGEGLDQGFFGEAREDLAALTLDYNEVVIPTEIYPDQYDIM